MSKLSDFIQKGNMQFYNDSLSSLPGGAYEIETTLSLPNPATNNFSETYKQKFNVRAPQFVLPDSDIVSLFPPANSNGNFNEYLPVALLDNPAFPWERQIDSSSRSTPWMALLIFRENEIVIDQYTGSPLINSSVDEFLTAEPEILKPAIDKKLLSPEELAMQMNSILISTEVFQAVTPRLQELSSLAHVREINPEDQEVSGNELDGWFSVIIANRFPYEGDGIDLTGAINYAHLVSFEGLTDYLVDNPDWKENKYVNLVSLASWTFTNVPQVGETFADLAENLITQAKTPEELLLRIPVANGDSSAAAKRLSEGYTALSYHTMPGPNTFAWYRGPFSPVVPQALPVAVINHPSEAMIYDQPNAIFDNSYADAWNTGRLVALADPAFIMSVQQLARRIHLLTVRLLERSKMPHLSHIKDPEALAAPGLTRKTFIEHVQNGLSEKMSGVFAGATEKQVEKQRSKNFLFPNEEMPSSPVEELKWFREKPLIKNFLKKEIEEDIDPIATWMAKLMLLYNVPFNHLVPDQRMLPAESIRFFHTDSGWLRTLFDGAMSVLSHSSRSIAIAALIKEVAWPTTLLNTLNVRRKLLRKEKVIDLPALPAAGLLLRSALVSGWPGLAVNATAKGSPVNIMRIERVSPSILLVLWDVVPDTVSISEPQQGIVFGVEERGADRIVKLRSLAAADLGAQLPNDDFPKTGGISDYMRPVNNGIGGKVVQWVPAVKGTPGYVVPGISEQLGFLQNTISSAQLAIEMVKAPQQILFNPLTAFATTKKS